MFQREKPPEISAEGFNMGSIKLNFLAEGNTKLFGAGVYYDVSSGIPHKNDGSTANLITSKKISRNLWMLDIRYFMYLISTAIDQYFTPQGIELPLFLQTFKAIAICDMYKKKYRRNKSDDKFYGT